MAPKRRGGGGPKGFFRERPQAGAEKPLIYKPRAQYPHITTPKLIPLRNAEQRRIKHFRALRKAHRDGPLYTVLDASARVSKPSDLPGMRTFGYSTAQAAANAAINTKEVNPFESLPTFSQKYKKPRRPVPKLEGGDYIKMFFPVELHQYIDPSAAPQQTGGVASKARLKLTAAEEEEMLEDEEAIMEEEDDDFEDDEDDDDDYNAENYFSDGKSDGGGDEGGGGDDY